MLIDKHDDILDEYLTLFNSYIDGLKDGFNSSKAECDIKDYLTDLRNNGEKCEYIDGYKDGYYIAYKAKEQQFKYFIRKD